LNGYVIIKIADAGCGLGDTSFRLAKSCDNVNIIGFDNSKLFIKNAINTLNSQHKDLADRITFEEGDIFKLKYPDATFDVIICERVLQHLEAFEDALTELLRILKPGGRLVVQDPCWTTLSFSGPSENICAKLQTNVLNVIRNPRIGIQMPIILKRRGLTNVRVHPVAWYCDRLEDCCVWNPETTLLESNKLWTVEEGKLWWQEVIEANSKGYFYASLSIFCTLGHKIIKL